MEGGLAEVRRLHIVYFLSREGRIEHPHLVRVRRPSRNGVHLRDVKRWLGELRGKEMPESFSWSYKRKYKTGYVWQDLLDDDLITPISDNEYVLKGSEIPSSNTLQEEKTIKQKEEEDQSHSPETSMYVSTKSSPDLIEVESQVFGSDTSTVTENSGKIETNKDSDSAKQEIEEHKERENHVHSEKDKKNTNTKVSFQRANISTTLTSDSSAGNKPSSEARSAKSKSGSSMFRNLMTCGVVDTKDSVAAFSLKNKLLQKNKPLLNTCASADDAKTVQSSKVCTGDGLGGSQRVIGNPRWTQHPWSGR